jgi:hypothetical protein
VYAADLLVSFSQTVTDFPIMYAPEEYGCDSSARMRVTAYMNGAYVGAATTTACPPGTWPTGTLSCAFAQGFNSVVVHYDAPPPTGGDWGPIFMADNMRFTPAPYKTGDMNCDGYLDGFDLAPFFLALQGVSAVRHSQWRCQRRRKPRRLRYRAILRVITRVARWVQSAKRPVREHGPRFTPALADAIL